MIKLIFYTRYKLITLVVVLVGVVVTGVVVVVVTVVVVGFYKYIGTLILLQV